MVDFYDIILHDLLSWIKRVSRTPCVKAKSCRDVWSTNLTVKDQLPKHDPERNAKREKKGKRKTWQPLIVSSPISRHRRNRSRHKTETQEERRTMKTVLFFFFCCSCLLLESWFHLILLASCAPLHSSASEIGFRFDPYTETCSPHLQVSPNFTPPTKKEFLISLDSFYP